MNARNMSGPSQALPDMLSRLRDGIMAMQQRSNWFRPVNTFGGNVALVNTPPLAFDPGLADAVTVLTATLDPGRWIIVGRGTQEVQFSYPYWRGLVMVEADFFDDDGNPVTDNRWTIVEAWGDLFTSYVESSTSLSVALEVKSTGPITVRLKMYAGTDYPSPPGPNVYNQILSLAQLVAFPG